ncbi:hypothetical protein J7E97_03390 [Streptomyces sp. ISL-66]|uniref:hypothetical protein n=1 Tax=Streptomyces sp. ISL-66 TaxID=2819186 RepID=UPI001BEBD040|nr:hypothetical protein [Streptomyces sp. ISL-66]MBT2466937.1 hypothetical protein [Streptomyces sp. ISL-66]
MVGFISRAVLLVAGGAVLAGLTVPAGAAGRDPAVAPRAAASPSAAPWTYCGVERGGGLAVHAKGKPACPTALKVAQEFYRASRRDPATERPVTVKVDGVPWKCESREGSPNPYIACVNQNDRSNEFQLNS